MSDIQRPRKTNPNFIKENNWRNKKHNNTATRRYTREIVLNDYKESSFPVPLTESILPLFSADSLVPFIIANPNYRELLGDDINSRKPVPREKPAEQVPEWYTESEAKELNSSGAVLPDQIKVDQSEINILNDVQEEFGKIDLEVEEKLKGVLDEDESMPEWDDPSSEPTSMDTNRKRLQEAEKEPEKQVQQQASKLVPFYDAELLKQQMSLKNPFAIVLAECALLGSDNLAYLMPFSRPFEKFWFYKDLAKRIQGPFCTIEMFNWSIRGCFPADLGIAQSNTENFIPMNRYFAAKEAPVVLQESEEKQKLEEVVKIEEKSYQRFGNTYNEMFPAFEPAKSKTKQVEVWEEVKKSKPNTKVRNKAK